MSNQEKKRLKELIEKLEDCQAEISVMIMQEQIRLDSIGNGASQIGRATKLEDNVKGLEEAEESLGDSISSLEEILA